MASLKEGKKIKTARGDIWELSTTAEYYCPKHGKCPAVLEKRFPNGFETQKSFGVSPFFFCKGCGMVKMVNVWNNCSGLVEATEI